MESHRLLENAAEAYYDGDPASASALWPQALSAYREDPSSLRLIDALLMSGLCVLLRGNGANLLLLAEVKALVERRLALEPDTADTYAFRAERAVAELRAAASVVKAQELCAEAMDLIEIALARFGTDVHVLVVAAQFFFNLPENLGGSRERAHAYLLAACDDARRGAAMRRLLAKKFPEAS